MTSSELAQRAVAILDNKETDELKVSGVQELSMLADYFVLATSTSSTHVEALAGELEFQLRETGTMPDHVEGHRSNSWIFLDYGHVVIHVFTTEARRFYDLGCL